MTACRVATAYPISSDGRDTGPRRPFKRRGPAEPKLTPPEGGKAFLEEDL